MNIFYLLLSLHVTDDTIPQRTKCANDQGDGPHDKKCIFPFERSHNGITYDSCAPDDGDGPEWCATTVDDDGVYQSGSGQWGVCGTCECGTGNGCEIPPGKHKSSEKRASKEKQPLKRT